MKQKLFFLLAPLSLGCSQLIGADFDPKTYEPLAFGGESGENKGSGGESSGSGGTSSSGGASSGDGSGGDGSGGDGSGGSNNELCPTPQDCPADDVVINEVRGQGGTDYIELYNNGAAPADLSGYHVTDGTAGPDTGSLATLASGSIVMPGDFLFLQRQEVGVACLDNSSSCQRFDFGIAASGDTVYLLTPSLSVQDSLNYPDETDPVEGLENGESIGRLPDGSDNIAALSLSPAAANSASTL